MAELIHGSVITDEPGRAACSLQLLRGNVWIPTLEPSLPKSRELRFVEFLVPRFSQSQTFPWETFKGLGVHKHLLPLGSARASKSCEFVGHGSGNVLLPSFIAVSSSVLRFCFALHPGGKSWGLDGLGREEQGWNSLLVLHPQKWENPTCAGRVSGFRCESWDVWCGNGSSLWC